MTTRAEWEADGLRRFGSDRLTWRFVCPSCGHVASVEDWKKAGAPANAVAFSCVGRWLPSCVEMGVRPGPCNYAGGGLFALNPRDVDGVRYFDFAQSAFGSKPEESR